MTDRRLITPPPPHLLKKFSAQAQDEAKKRNGAGYLKTFATLCIEWAMTCQSTPNDRQIRSSEIGPSPDLIRKWAQHQASQDPEVLWRTIATQAARWGADQELEACIKYFFEYDSSWGENSELITGLRAARRSKPKSLAEEALETLMQADGADHPVPVLVLPADEAAKIRRALERLQELEGKE